MAIWSAPKTWSAEASQLETWNTYLQQNMEALKNPPTDIFTGSYASGAIPYSATPLTFADIDTDFNLSLATVGGDILVLFHADVIGIAYFDIEFDGARIGGNDGIIATSADMHVSMTWLIRDVIEGTHTINLQWKSAGALIALYGDYISQFTAREVS